MHVLTAEIFRNLALESRAVLRVIITPGLFLAQC